MFVKVLVTRDLPRGLVTQVWSINFTTQLLLGLGFDLVLLASSMNIELGPWFAQSLLQVCLSLFSFCLNVSLLVCLCQLATISVCLLVCLSPRLFVSLSVSLCAYLPFPPKAYFLTIYWLAIAFAACPTLLNLNSR